MNLPFRHRCALPALVLAFLLCPAPAVADSSDQDRARAALEAGRVLPLDTLLDRLAREHPGRLLEVELEEEGGRLVYEVKLLQPDGRLLKLELDAATGEVVERRMRADERGRGH